MADVFISYISERRAAAEHLAEILADYGYSVWWDYALVSGKDFGAQIERELRAAKAVVVLWCGLSRESEWVKEEATLAKRLDKIVPAIIENVELPLGFTMTQTLDLATWNGAPQSEDLERLLRDIARLTGRAPVPNKDGLERTERAWHRFGAPSLSGFALVDPIERDRPPRTLPDALSPREVAAPARAWQPSRAALTGAAVISAAIAVMATVVNLVGSRGDPATVVVAPTEVEPYRPLPGEPDSIAYVNADTGVSGHIARNTGARWTEYNDEMTTGRPWIQTPPKDATGTKIELADGDVKLTIDLSANKILYTDPAWPGYPTPQPLYDITNIR
ncbi:MAG: toll/interleukin-1 receptor domain-containing protein [Micropepsaceae bacterium]